MMHCHTKFSDPETTKTITYMFRTKFSFDVILRKKVGYSDLVIVCDITPFHYILPH